MRRALVAIATGLALLLAACTGPTPTQQTTTTSTASATPERPFTIATTEPVTVADPAAAANDPASIIAYNVFQRLMTTSPGDNHLRPDAAQDCLYTSATVYECRLRQNLRFHNGNPVTSYDVKFSILRAFRLGVVGSSATALSSLDRIDTPSSDVVRFNLKWADNEFGYALTSPAASIVDSKIYDADLVRPLDQTTVGSGPYRLSWVNKEGLIFTSFEGYVGATTPQVERIALTYFKDSASIEDAMSKGLVDMTWRGLSAAAVKRLQQQVRTNQTTNATDTGFKPTTLYGSRLHTLSWNPKSGSWTDATIRQAVASALQEDRTLDSLLPPAVEGHVAAFPVGGSVSAPSQGGPRMRLTLGYAALAPDEADLANRVRNRIEAVAGVSVQLVPDSTDTDLRLADTRAWVAEPVAFLLQYLDSPVPGSASKLSELNQRYRGSEKDARATALAEIQKQAAADLTVLPMNLDDETVFTGSGFTLTDPKFGPGWQLGLWSIKKG